MKRLKVALFLSSTVFLAGCGMADDARTLARSAAAFVFDPLIAVQSTAALAPASLEKDLAQPDSLPEQRFLKASLTPASPRRQVVRVICASRVIVVVRYST